MKMDLKQEGEKEHCLRFLMSSPSSVNVCGGKKRTRQYIASTELYLRTFRLDGTTYLAWVLAARSLGRKSCSAASFSGLCDSVALNTSFWSCAKSQAGEIRAVG